MRDRLRFLGKGQHACQRFVDCLGGRERFLNLRLQDNHIAALSELLVIFPAHSDVKLFTLQFGNVLVILACRSFFHIESSFAH